MICANLFNKAVFPAASLSGYTGRNLLGFCTCAAWYTLTGLVHTATANRSTFLYFVRYSIVEQQRRKKSACVVGENTQRRRTLCIIRQKMIASNGTPTKANIHSRLFSPGCCCIACFNSAEVCLFISRTISSKGFLLLPIIMCTWLVIITHA